MNKSCARKWASRCFAVAILAASLLWANWWKISFRGAAVVGQTESALIGRHGPPEYDSRFTPSNRYRPTDEQERVELGLDDDNDYTLIWITGILGQNNVKIHFTGGVATGVERSSHR
jgi:hypothetical protein